MRNYLSYLFVVFVYLLTSSIGSAQWLGIGEDRYGRANYFIEIKNVTTGEHTHSVLVGEKYAKSQNGGGYGKNYKSMVSWVEVQCRKNKIRSNKQVRYKDIGGKNVLDSFKTGWEWDAPQGMYSKVIKVVCEQIAPKILEKLFNDLSEDIRKTIQITLKNLGLYQSSIDGKYGKGTKLSIEEFNNKFAKLKLNNVSVLPKLLNDIAQYEEILVQKQNDQTVRLQKEKEEREELKRKRREAAKNLQIAVNEFNKNRLKRVSTNVGFRNIKPGMLRDEIVVDADCDLIGGSPQICYGLDNIKFLGSLDRVKVEEKITQKITIDKQFHLLKTLTVDLGPISQGFGMLQALKYYSDNPDQGNIYSSMRKNLKKYELEFEFSERDRELFNEKQKKELLVVYEKGQVVLRLFRQKKDYSSDIWLYLEYRDVDNGEVLFKESKPKRASSSDF